MLAKKIGLILAGGALGGLAGYLIALSVIRKMNEKAFEELKDEWIPESDTIEEQASEAEDTEKHNEALREKTDYRAFSKDKESLDKLVEPYQTPAKQIRIISAQEASDSKAPFQQVKYYDGDNTFCDIQEKVIENPNDMFVPNVWLHFGEQSEDHDIVYIQNDKVGIVYEITRIHNKYTVVVLGEPDKPPHQPRRRRGKTTKVVEEENGPEPEES